MDLLRICCLFWFLFIFLQAYTQLEGGRRRVGPNTNKKPSQAVSRIWSTVLPHRRVDSVQYRPIQRLLLNTISSWFRPLSVLGSLRPFGSPDVIGYVTISYSIQTISYWWSFVTKPLSLTVSEIFNGKCDALVDVTLIRPLNKGRGHSFWYQSIPRIRLPIGCQTLLLLWEAPFSHNTQATLQSTHRQTTDRRTATLQHKRDRQYGRSKTTLHFCL